MNERAGKEPGAGRAGEGRGGRNRAWGASNSSSRALVGAVRALLGACRGGGPAMVRGAREMGVDQVVERLDLGRLRRAVWRLFRPGPRARDSTNSCPRSRGARSWN